jgi:hypothetical protein
VTNASVLVLNVRGVFDEMKHLAQINKNIIVLPIDIQKHSLDQFISNHVTRLEIDLWVIIPRAGLHEDISKQLEEVIRVREQAESEASLPKSAFALRILILGRDAKDAKKNKQTFLNVYRHLSNVQIVIMGKADLEDIARFLQEHANNKMAKVEQILKTVDAGKIIVCDSVTRDTV